MGRKEGTGDARNRRNSHYILAADTRRERYAATRAWPQRSTLKGDFRYTSNTVFDTFAWPQNPTKAQVRAVVAAARALRQLRSGLRRKHGLSLRELYRATEKPGKHPLSEARAKLASAVRAAYGMPPKADVLQFLLDLNHKCAAAEAAGHSIQGPGVPASFGKTDELVSDDCIAMPGLRLMSA
jgi:hypothetical protein